MNSLRKTTLNGVQAAGIAAVGLASVVARSLRSAAVALHSLIAERRKAYVADTLTAHLKHMSDADLAKLGVRREDIPQFVRERLYS